MDTNKTLKAFIRTYRSLLIAEGMMIQEGRFELRDGEFVHRETAVAWWSWQASRATSDELPAMTDELLAAAYWDFDARRKGYPPYAAPAGQECGAFKAAIVSAIEAQGLKVAP